MWQDLEHHVWKKIQTLPLNEKKYLLCFSGGADSTALFWILKALKVPFSVVHFHHGKTTEKKQVRFRDQAQKFVENLCESQGVECLVEKSSKTLKSEAEFRDFRLNYLKNKTNSHWIFLAHQMEDLFETRILRLIRGTGPEGIKAMKFQRGSWVRPLLEISGKELKAYLNQRQKTWLEDPSNQDPRYLRNWVRHKWLPQLDARQQGAVQRFAQSLENLAPIKTPRLFLKIRKEKCISTGTYWTLSEPEQIQALAVLLKSHFVDEFTLSHLREVQRRLFEQKSKEAHFRIAQVEWRINAEQILVQR